MASVMAQRDSQRLQMMIAKPEDIDKLSRRIARSIFETGDQDDERTTRISFITTDAQGNSRPMGGLNEDRLSAAIAEAISKTWFD